jgi:peptidoglycan/LPS O-acetylase OafA/YrhL
MLYRVHAGRAAFLTYALLGIAVAVSMFGPHWVFRPLPRPVYAGTIAFFAILVWFATSAHARILRLPPLLFLGRISYPLYLVHQVVGFAVMAKLEGWELGPDVTVLGTAAIAILLAWLISNAIERPAQRWLRALFAAQRGKFLHPAAVVGPVL